MTEGSILGKMAQFTLPIIVGNLLQQLYTIVDTLIVGRTLGVDKLAAVGAAGSPHFLAMGFIMGISSGCAIMTSNYFGSGNTKELKKSVSAHILIAGLLAILFTICFTGGTDAILVWMNTSSDIFADTAIYLRVLYLGMPAVVLYNMLSSLLRAVGDSKTPLLLLVGSSVLNIVLDLVFILVFNWDVAGAAIATVFSQFLSAILCLVYAFRRVPILIPTKESWQDMGSMIMAELKIGIPMGAQFTVIAAGMMVLQSALNGFGADAVAAYTIGERIRTLCQNVFMSIGTAMSTFVGQNAGAKQYGRIKEGISKCLIVSVIFSLTLGALVWFFIEPLTMIFIDSNELAVDAVIALTKQYMAWGCPLFWSLALIFVCRGVLQGLGDGLVPMLGGILELVMRSAIPILFSRLLGFTAICIASVAAWVACALLMGIVCVVRIRRLSNKQKLIAI